MPTNALKRKRSLQTSLVSVEAELKSIKRDIVKKLDEAKALQDDVNTLTRSRAQARYKSLLSELNARNEEFDERILDLKTQIYEIEAKTLIRPAANTTNPSSQSTRSSGPPLPLSTTSTDRMMNRSRPQRIEQTIQDVERSLKSSGYEGFLYLPACPLLVREVAQEGKTRSRWLQMHCAACGSTTKGNSEYFVGLTGILSHMSLGRCRLVYRARELTAWEYMILECAQEVDEQHVLDVVSGRIELPRVRNDISTAKDSKDQEARRTETSKLQRLNSYYEKPPPRKFNPSIIDLDGESDSAAGPDQTYANNPPSFVRNARAANRSDTGSPRSGRLSRHPLTTQTQ